ncbi:amino acid ABC transporter substrate-binding protein [candidate division KSB3 bacterium]|uniref:Amino acid ABC transporter substrate-binding protein n=1 Tax=candidate division KSB3 bacterium TaxID=2044937 RepID=A0A2G6KL77_9BACT|nr:MAG: amino acid ABC transporter substrate-binding protein [candidate division KSB3 bacterium]
MGTFKRLWNVSTMIGLMLVFGLFVLPVSSVVAEEEIYVGVSAPLTGDNAEYGEYFRSAVLLGMEHINAKGGINGASLKLLIEDSKAEPKEGVLIAQKFISDSRILAVVGDFNSSTSMAAAEIYSPGGLVQISPTASHPDFTTIGEYIFRAGTTQAMEGPFLAKWAVEDLGYQKIATIYINNDWGLVANKYFVEKAKELGATITNEESFIVGDKDFTAIITKIKQQNPDMVFFATTWADAAAIAIQMRKLDFSPALMGPGALSTDKLIEMAGPAVEGIKANAIYFIHDTRPVSANFTADYRKKYGKYPHDHCGLAYDALMLLANAIEKAGTDRAAIRDTLAATEGYEGVTGVFRFDEQRNPIKEFIKIEVRDGKWQIAEK